MVILKPKSAFQHLKSTVDQDAYEWLKVNGSGYLEAIERELQAGQTPEEIYHYLLREIGPDRAALARRCRNAARWVVGQIER